MDFLGFTNWTITGYEEDDSRFFIRANYVLKPESCQNCFASAGNLCRYGKRNKVFKDLPGRGKQVSVKLTIQRYKCSSCKKVFIQKVDEVAEGMRITKRLVDYAGRQAVENGFAAVSRDTGVDENTVRELFTQFAGREQRAASFPTPRVLGIDDVYVRRKARCIITDIENRRVIELLPGAERFTVTKHLLDIKNKENIKAVTMDMSLAFRSAVREMLPNAKIVIDKYHVQRMGKKAIDKFLEKIRGSVAPGKKRKYLRDRFVLYRRSHTLKKDRSELLKRWSQDLPGIAELYNLKEEFMRIWSFANKKAAVRAYRKWERKIPTYLKFAFKEIITSFRNWFDEIFNYFDYRFTNAYTESANNLVKNIQKQSRGCSFEVVRAKMLCRSIAKLREDERKPSPETNKYSFTTSKKQQRVLRLQQARQQNSEVFAILFPKEPSWADRFKPYLGLLHRDE